jgi:hypothetical protein
MRKALVNCDEEFQISEKGGLESRKRIIRIRFVSCFVELQRELQNRELESETGRVGLPVPSQGCPLVLVLAPP